MTGIDLKDLLFHLCRSIFRAPERVKSESDENAEGRSMIWGACWHTSPESVDQELLLRKEYLAIENRILLAKIKGRFM
jgi:hypothetical protein